VETKWHGGLSDFIIMLNDTFVLSDVGGLWLLGVAFYWGIPFEITQRIFVSRLSWVRYEVGKK
jgi:hypothetical protein